MEDPALLRSLLDILNQQRAMILSQQFAILALFEQLSKARLVDPDVAADRMRSFSFELPDVDDLDEVTLSLCLRIIKATEPQSPDDGGGNVVSMAKARK